jgi:GTP-binding protein HflX
VLIDRRGVVAHVMVGGPNSIELPDWGRLRAGVGRLRGLRCIHTHLGSEGLSRDDLTDLLLLRLDAMVSVAALEDGLPGLAHIACLEPTVRSDKGIDELKPVHPARIDIEFGRWIRELEDDLARSVKGREIESRDRAILVSVTAGRSAHELELHLDELRELARAADVAICDTLTQNRRVVDPKTVVGRGKMQDLMVMAFQSDVDLLIFDQDLTPTQARNLSSELELRVIDRSQLILDIFAGRAQTRDGQVQVELAQLKYRLPRLAQQSDVSLSRLAGGIGGRGPGETKLEVDRRRVRDRITRLTRETKKLAHQREQRRRKRSRRGVPVLSIVGYTNAGKSTLLRSLTHADPVIEDKMFATLDPMSRRLRFPREREVIITDTVGFIRDLPPELVAAFHATLEELNDAVLLLHVVDAAAPDIERRIEAVHDVLESIGLGGTPELLILNQVDRLPEGVGDAIALRHRGIAVSALENIGLHELLVRAEEILWGPEGPDFDRRLVDGLVVEAEGV